MKSRNNNEQKWFKVKMYYCYNKGFLKTINRLTILSTKTTTGYKRK